MATTTNIETEAFVVDEPNAPFKLTPIIIDEMRDDEFLIEMKYSGICHTVSTLVVYIQIRYLALSGIASSTNHEPDYETPHRCRNRITYTYNRSSSGKQTCFLA